MLLYLAKSDDDQTAKEKIDALNALLIEKDSTLSNLNPEIAKMRAVASECEALQSELDSLRGSFEEKDRAICALQEELGTIHDDFIFDTKKKHHANTSFAPSFSQKSRCRPTT